MSKYLEYDPRESKLPKYAQETIIALRVQLERLTTDNKALREGQFTSNVASPVRLAGIVSGEDVVLPEDSMVRFDLEHGTVNVSLERRGTGITVRADDLLSVEPVASNTIVIKSRSSY